LVDDFDLVDLQTPSFCTDWTVAQVLSHLGSQAEIVWLFVNAGLQGAEPPTQSEFPPIWDNWNGRGPESQAHESVAANEAFIARFEAMSESELAAFRLQLFGMDLDAAGLLRMRLAEHAVHSWDVAVAFDPDAQVASDAVELLIDGLGDMVARIGRPADPPATVAVVTRGPSRQFLLTTGQVGLTPGSSNEAGPSLELPAESFLRLVYGRLDDAHVPPGEVHVIGTSLDELRAVFPGV